MKDDTRKREYRELVNTLKEIGKQKGTKITNEFIAEALGYNRSYFSQLLGEKGVVTADHIKYFKLHFPTVKEPEEKTLVLQEPVSEYKLSLEKSIENLTENELRTTAIIERMLSLLEKQYSGLPMAPKGTAHTETMNPRKNKKPAQ